MVSEERGDELVVGKEAGVAKGQDSRCEVAREQSVSCEVEGWSGELGAQSQGTGQEDVGAMLGYERALRRTHRVSANADDIASVCVYRVWVEE